MASNATGSKEGIDKTIVGVLLDDLREYCETQRSYLLMRRDNAETDKGRSIYIGMLRQLAGVERAILQMTTPDFKPGGDAERLPKNYQELGVIFLRKLGLGNNELDDFQVQKYCDKLANQFPEKRQAILFIRRLVTNRVMVDYILKYLSSLFITKAPKEIKPQRGRKTGAKIDKQFKCPLCAKRYAYWKAYKRHCEQKHNYKPENDKDVEND